MHILKVLDPIEKLETKIADLYEWFSAIFSDDAEAAALFYRISVDETAHANLVRYQRRLAAQNMKLFGEISLDLGALNGTLDKVASILSGPRPSLEDAVKIALDLENSAAEAHYRTAVEEASPAIPAISQLLRSLTGFDSKHCQVFEEFAASRNFPLVSKSVAFSFRQSAPGASNGKTFEDAAAIAPETLERIEYYYKWHKTMNFYGVLGIKNHAADNEIRRAFHTLASEFHPDRYMNAPGEILHKLSAVFSYMTTAYTTLVDPAKRQEYDKTLT